MKFICKLRVLAKKGIDRNMKLEYKNAIRRIKLDATDGCYTAKFNVSKFYENKDDIYIYIMDKLKAQGLRVDVENYGCNMSHKRLVISWKDK